MHPTTGNLIVTAANSAYFDTLLTLISSIHRHSLNTVDVIVVMDIGLDEEQVIQLKRLQKVQVYNLRKEMEKDRIPYEDYLSPKGHAYKIYCVAACSNFGCANVLWLDGGVMLLQPVDEIFKVIERDHIFLVGDTHLNRNFTHNDCRRIMNATSSELNDVQLSSGILGYRAWGRFDNFIMDALAYSLHPQCVVGDHQNHRHDQSVYSILASRYSIPKHNIDRYGYWTDLHRTLETAIANDAVIFVHRRGHRDHSNLVYRPCT